MRLRSPSRSDGCKEYPAARRETAGMDTAIKRAIAALTFGADAQRHFDLAADRIAHALLEVTIPKIDGIEIGVKAEPSRLVGGDYIDLFVRGPASVVFGLGDASGKSLAAALNALMLRYLVRGLVTALGTDDLPLLVKHANTVVTQDVDADSFVTFIIGEVDRAAGTLRLVNAGHEPALILRSGAERLEVTAAQGLVLGVSPDAEYQQQLVPIASGDTIVLYTDGLTEATNERGELFTIDRLCDDIVANRALRPQELAESVFETVRAFAQGELRDDSTILVLRVWGGRTQR
jgi:sigma-B regulation protein RsbU (phosphoserine phosphatase)